MTPELQRLDSVSAAARQGSIGIPKSLAAWRLLLLLSAAAVTGCATAGGSSPAGEPPAAAAEFSRLETSTDRTDTSPPPAELPEDPTLSDYLSWAALHNPGLEAAFNRWQAALQEVTRARALPDPRFTYRYYIEEVETRVGPQKQAFELSQMFPWFGKLRSAGDAEAARAEAARHQYEAAKLSLFYKVKEAYYEYYYLSRAISIVGANLELLSRVEEVARTAYEGGGARYADVVRAQVELGRLDDRLRTLDDLRGPAAARLNAALDRPVSAFVPWPREIILPEIAATEEEVLEALREGSPELMALDSEVAREAAMIETARRGYWPDITLGLSYIDTDSALMHGTPDSGKDPVMAMFSVNLPLDRKKYRAAETAARARHRAAATSRRQRENDLAFELKTALYLFRDAGRKIDLYRHALIPKAKQALEASEAAFRAGTISFADLIDAQRVWLEFELSYQRSLADRAARLAQLEMMVGREIADTGHEPIDQGNEMSDVKGEGK